MSKFKWTYPQWAKLQYQAQFEERAARMLCEMPAGRYRIYLPYYQYACCGRVFSAPHQRYTGDKWIPIVVISKWNELTIGRCAIKVGEVTVSGRHTCPRCSHCVLDHSKPAFQGSLAVAEWSKCTCGCEFYTEEIFAPYDHKT